MPANDVLSCAGLSILGGKKGIDVVGKLVASQANVLAKASLDDIGRQGAREGAMEAVVGSYVRLQAPELSPHMLHG